MQSFFVICFQAIFEDCCVEDGPIESEAKQDFVLMQIVSRDKATVEDIKSKVAERIQTDSKPLHMEFPPNSEEVLQDKEIMVIIKQMQHGHIEINMHQTG